MRFLDPKSTIGSTIPSDTSQRELGGELGLRQKPVVVPKLRAFFGGTLKKSGLSPFQCPKLHGRNRPLRKYFHRASCRSQWTFGDIVKYESLHEMGLSLPKCLVSFWLPFKTAKKQYQLQKKTPAPPPGDQNRKTLGPKNPPARITTTESR